MTLEEQKKAFVSDIARDRRAWWSVMVPQLLLVGIASLSLAAIAGFGLYTAIVVFREKADAELLSKGTSVFVGGTSTFMGFVVTKLLAKLTELSQEFMAQNRRFTSFTARVKGAATATDYDQTAKDYEK